MLKTLSPWAQRPEREAQFHLSSAPGPPSHAAWMIPITLRLKQNSASPPIEIKLDSGQTRALQLRRKIPRLTLYLHVTFIL